ncbi:hypothetical protein [Phnomibacter ginsenosidimutans]|uniref:Uncharacterized protein n=1 Tax=Phnomibacter ginsenosidimutans TaxID=2676868 RepID=A0A6I6H1F0_9BACT|nr:hypothetical protein [Phnomibacter ginsenosidimutans]QGW28461.1 hypothetical protein GLV81_10445 [Phnomibacter ginsenosidimutans]
MTLWDDLMQNFWKDGTREWHKGKIISSIVVVLALIVFAFYNSRRLKANAADRKANLKYTIGVTGKTHHNIKSSQPTVEFTYNVGMTEYSGNEMIAAQFEKSVVANGGRYYVEFSSKNPNNSKLLLDYPVPDTVTNTQEEGWTYMPGYNNKR